MIKCRAVRTGWMTRSSKDRAQNGDGGTGRGNRRRDGFSTRDRQREETRLRVFAACRSRSFDGDGVAQSRIDEIAKLAGVSHGTFYFHFPTKDDVLAELLDLSEQRITAAIESLAADAPTLELLECFSVAMAREWREDRSIFPDAAMVGLRLAAAGGSGREAGRPAHRAGQAIRARNGAPGPARLATVARGARRLLPCKRVCRCTGLVR